MDEVKGCADLGNRVFSRIPDISEELAALLRKQADNPGKVVTFEGIPIQDLLTARGAAPIMREFETGATRSSDVGKLDYEGFLSPEVLEMFATYMNRHRTQADGAPRTSDNWQKGMPRDNYMKSLLRHVWDAWKIHRGIEVKDKETGMAMTIEDALCAALFNVQGYLFERIHNR